MRQKARIIGIASPLWFTLFTDAYSVRQPGFPLSPNEVVFFYITNVEYDVLKTESNPDIYVSSTTGELGCWVDPAITRIIQTGVEHCWVPDVGTYLESGTIIFRDACEMC